MLGPFRHQFSSLFWARLFFLFWEVSGLGFVTQEGLCQTCSFLLAFLQFFTLAELYKRRAGRTTMCWRRWSPSFRISPSAAQTSTADHKGSRSALLALLYQDGSNRIQNRLVTAGRAEKHRSRNLLLDTKNHRVEHSSEHRRTRSWERKAPTEI